VDQHQRGEDSASRHEARARSDRSQRWRDLVYALSQLAPDEFDVLAEETLGVASDLAEQLDGFSRGIPGKVTSHSSAPQRSQSS
jgi:hypothetical protein